MRIQVFPLNGIALIGTRTVEIDGSLLPSADVAEFSSDDLEHPFYGPLVDLISSQVKAQAVPSMTARSGGLCRGQTRYDGDFRINTFTFDHIGDRLPWHTHDESTVHTTLVLSGKLTARFEGGERTIGQGDFLDWQPGEWHEFIAVDAGSVIENRVKQPQAPV